MPTISDVAAAAGVSRGTVSHVLSGRIAVATETRRRVTEAIEALGYRPAEVARSLTARRRGPRARPRHDPAVPRLTTVGYVSVDYMACLDRLPLREERRVASAILKLIGGPAANVATIAAGIGPPWPVAASLLTNIGDDQDSDWAVAELSARGVETLATRARHGGRLTRALVLVEGDGRRTILNEPLGLGELDLRRFVETARPAGTWCLHVEGYQVPRQSAVVPLARARGFVTSMHAVGLPQDWLAHEGETLFRDFDLAFLHRETLMALCPGAPDPMAAAALLAARARALPPGAPWPRAVVITLGAAGAIALERGAAPVHVPTRPVEVRDLTGAGDTLVGTVLALVLNGVGLVEAVRLGCLAGGLAVTRFGAAEVRPSAGELVSLLATMEPPT